MDRFKSREYWVRTLVMCVGMSLVMTIATPLLMGGSLEGQRFFVDFFIGLAVALVINIIVPLGEIGAQASVAMTGQVNKHIVSLIISLLMVILMGHAIFFIHGNFTSEAYQVTLSVMPAQLVFAFLATYPLDWVVQKLL